MRAKFGWCGIACLAAGFAGVFGFRGAALNELRAEYNRAKAATDGGGVARAEHARLRSMQPTAGEIAQLRIEAANLPQARADLMKLRGQVERAAQAEAERSATPAPRFAVGDIQPAAQWRNAGNATPQAALETALWAGAGGDVEAFAKTLILINSATKRAAQALWAGLPEEMRANYNSPEQLIAFLAVRDVPLGSAQVQESSRLEDWPVPATMMRLRFTNAEDKRKDATLVFMNPGEGWKLVVTEGVVAKYAAMLKQPEVTAVRPK